MIAIVARTTNEEPGGDSRGRDFSPRLIFGHDTRSPTGNISADLINARTRLFFDAKDLITFLHRLVNHLGRSQVGGSVLLAESQNKKFESQRKEEKRTGNTCCSPGRRTDRQTGQKLCTSDVSPMDTRTEEKERERATAAVKTGVDHPG